MSYQTTFFDRSEILEKLDEKDPLKTLSEQIDFEIFRPVLNEVLSKRQKDQEGGRGMMW